MKTLDNGDNVDSLDLIFSFFTQRKTKGFAKDAKKKCKIDDVCRLVSRENVKCKIEGFLKTLDNGDNVDSLDLILSFFTQSKTKEFAKDAKKKCKIEEIF